MKILRKHYFPIFVICLCTLLCLTSCGDNTKSEKELQNDLLGSEEFYDAQEVDVTSFEVEQRLTSKENKSDIVYVTVSVENDDVVGTLNYVMDYILYDNGWELVSVTQDTTPSFSPKSMPSDETVDGILKEALDNKFGDVPYEITEVNRDTSGGPVCDTSYQVEVHHTYVTLNYSYDVSVFFDNVKGLWENHEIHQIGDETATWDILGEYTRTKETTNWLGLEDDINFGKIAFTIKSVENGEVTFDISGPNRDGEYQELTDCTAKLLEYEARPPKKGEFRIAFDTNFNSESDRRVIEFEYDDVLVCNSGMGFVSHGKTNHFVRTTS